VAESDPFKWHHYQHEITLLCVRWYLRYALSYRDLEEMSIHSASRRDARGDRWKRVIPVNTSRRNTFFRGLSARCLDFYHEQVKTRRRKLTNS
jgi:hypothetical protein